MNSFSNIGAVYEAMRRSMVNLLPPPDMLPSEWAEKNNTTIASEKDNEAFIEHFT